MSRQDSWTSSDDATLRDLVLKNVREGRTQLAAFNQAAKELGRTASACGFRWNATVRKLAQKQMTEARTERKQFQQQKTLQRFEVPSEEVAPTETLMQWGEVMRFLRNEKELLRTWIERSQKLEREKKYWQKKAEELNALFFQLSNENQELRQEHHNMKEDYERVMKILEHSRIQTIQTELGENFPENFQYEIREDGVLERVKSS